jgi:hypothetical protein
MSTLATISPTEDDLAVKLRSLRETHPTTGLAKLLILLREIQPDWSVSEKRLKKVLQQEGLMISSGNLETTNEVNGAEKHGNGLATAAKAKKSAKGGLKKSRQYPTSSAESKVDATNWSEKVAIRHFDAVKGKGLVATAHIEEGEALWKEDPWVMTADWYVQSPRSLSSLGFGSLYTDRFFFAINQDRVFWHSNRERMHTLLLSIISSKCILDPHMSELYISDKPVLQ